MSDDRFFSFLERLGRDDWDLKHHEDIAQLKARMGDTATSSDLQRLEREMATLRRELGAIKIAFDVLAHAVVETGAVDAAELDRRMRAAIAHAEAVAPQPVVCSNCNMTYPPARIVTTDAGPLCKRCHALG